MKAFENNKLSAVREELEPTGSSASSAAPYDHSSTLSAFFSNKKRMLLILLVMIIAAGTAGFFLYKKKLKLEDDSQVAAIDDIIFTDLDEIIVNLDTKGKSMSFLKIKVTLELKDKQSQQIINKMMPKINDTLLIYLRGLRATDLQGSIALYRLREELMIRLNKLIFPAQITDILFRNVLVQ